MKIDPLTLLIKYGLIDRGDGTIYDTRTQLTWEQQQSKRYSWENAHKYCNALRLAGHKDWRLPTLEELKTLRELEEYMPRICPVFKLEEGWYWSSTICVDPGVAYYAKYIWCVNFHFGGVDYPGARWIAKVYNKDSAHPVRAVCGKVG